ncbi:MAG: hypothetical protein DSZ27_03510 [Thiomicrospira sp.]|nr:MAG: hypothetical protein DSZ27_03510 [Thiomicrospira sp.]
MEIKKPTKEMVNEAHRLAFFSSEILSQNILDSYENTKSYILRNQQELTEQGVISLSKRKVEVNQDAIKARKK